jgi:hypothetical protein
MEIPKSYVKSSIAQWTNSIRNTCELARNAISDLNQIYRIRISADGAKESISPFSQVTICSM